MGMTLVDGKLRQKYKESYIRVLRESNIGYLINHDFYR